MFTPTTPTTRSTPAIALAGLGIVAALAGCGGSSSSSKTSAAPSSTSSSVSSAAPSSSSSGSSSASSSSSAPAAAAKKITATETEFHIALSSKTLTPGTYTFVVKNGGSAVHALEVDGPGVDKKSTGDIAPGKTVDLTVSLQAGSYDVNCPVANHKMLGMDETVKVS